MIDGGFVSRVVCYSFGIVGDGFDVGLNDGESGLGGIIGDSFIVIMDVYYMGEGSGVG